MNEIEIRTLVRAAIAEHLGRPQPPAIGAAQAPSCAAHPSHALLMVPTGNTDGACVIEPAVPCTHCGFCRSYGH